MAVVDVSGWAGPGDVACLGLGDVPAAFVAQEVVDGIVRNGLEPGDMLPREKEMIAQYEVGRATLREALRSLFIYFSAAERKRWLAA